MIDLPSYHSLSSTAFVNLEVSRHVANLCSSGHLTLAAMKIVDHYRTPEGCNLFLSCVQRKYFSNDHVFKELEELVHAIVS